ncbi:MAG: hypothetical protein ACI9U2_002416 [Bradymonadia bacterium]|jgi:hypothetical protein
MPRWVPDRRVALPLATVVRDTRRVQVLCQNCDTASDRDGLDALPGGFGFVCPDCGHENLLAPVAARPVESESALLAPALSEPASPTPVDLPTTPVVPEPPQVRVPNDAGQIVCPKCQNLQVDDAACHRCGLLFANFDAGRAYFDSDLLANVAQADIIRARWDTLAGTLDDAIGHAAFIELCALHDALEFAADRYRCLAEDARVAPYQHKVVELALARVPLQHRAMTEDGDRTRRLIVLTIAALIMLGFAYGYYLLSQHQTHWQGNG